jgi:beta-galactosidase
MVPVYSGAVHYWRLDRHLWPAILDQVKSLGFGVVETYIPWSVHEVSPGCFDWGAADERKDIDAFMRLCEERGLWLLVRPGPLINAELTDFGFPEWVLLEPRVQAHTAVGSLHLDAAWGLHPPRPFPVPSYASERFFELVAGWYDAVCPIIARHLAPGGCVVAVQSDNETCYLFHDQPYATDYAPDSLALYRRYLSQQYATIDQLNSVYASEYHSFDVVEPPRDGPIAERSSAPWHLDWIAYKEFQIRWSVARLARMLRARGLGGVPIFHDVAYQLSTPLDISRMEADPDIDWVGLNLYRPPWEHRALADRVRFLAGSTRLPFVPELGAGLWSHHPVTPTPAEDEFVNLSVLMYGIKAFNFYMLVERERWQGSPIRRDGERRPEYAPFYQRFTAFLNDLEFWRFRREPRILVLRNYDLERYRAANSTLNYAHADLLRLPPELFEDERDLGISGLWLARAWLDGLTHALRRAGHDYDLSDTHVPLERLRRYALVCVECTEILAEEDQQRLRDYAADVGRLVIGPMGPSMDSYLRPCRMLEAAEVVADGAAFVETLSPAEYRVDHPAVEVVVHRDEARTLLFVSNPSSDTVASDLRFAGRRRIRSVWGEPRTAVADDQVHLVLGPWTVQIWAVDW